MGGDSGGRLHAFRSLAGNRALVRARENLEQGGLPRSAAACDSNQLTRLDGEGHLVEDLTLPGVLATPIASMRAPTVLPVPKRTGARDAVAASAG